MDCIFCKIIAGEIPSDVIYRDDEVIAFPDISPLAPTHLLIVPRKHIASLVDLSEADAPLAGHMIAIANRLAKSEGVAARGYRLVINCGREGGQGVDHLHLHLLGGRQLSNSLG